MLNSIDALKDDCYTLNTKAFWILHNINSHPKCLTCGKEMIGKNIKSLSLGYQNMHCSISCGNSDPNVLK